MRGTSFIINFFNKILINNDRLSLKIVLTLMIQTLKIMIQSHRYAELTGYLDNELREIWILIPSGQLKT